MADLAEIQRLIAESLPGAEVPSHVVLIETDWEDPQLRAGRALMARVHELAASLGADELGHTIDAPPVAPQYQEHAEARIGLLEATGYELLRDGLRWLLSSPRAEAQDGPLTFRTIAAVGQDGGQERHGDARADPAPAVRRQDEDVRHVAHLAFDVNPPFGERGDSRRFLSPVL